MTPVLSFGILTENNQQRNLQYLFCVSESLRLKCELFSSSIANGSCRREQTESRELNSNAYKLKHTPNRTPFTLFTLTNKKIKKRKRFFFFSLFFPFQIWSRRSIPCLFPGKMEQFIENLQPMDLMRSEKMTLVQLIIPAESAHRAISYLGELGLLQFRDVRSTLSDPVEIFRHFEFFFLFSTLKNFVDVSFGVCGVVRVEC